MATTPPPAYHPAVTRMLGRYLDADAQERLRQGARTDDGALATLLHTAALRASERHDQLARAIKHARSDLRAAAEELADGRCAEHVLTGRGNELLVAAHRHHDALAHLIAIADAFTTAPAEPAS
jgi:hypothetical protein